MTLEEKTLSSEVIAKSHFIEVRRDRVELPDGKESTREYFQHPGAVLIIPILANGDLVLERQYRYPVHEEMIEFPAGKLDAGEDSFDCAQRELLEETGYLAKQWTYAGQIYPCIGYSSEVIEVWFAKELEAGKAQLDEGEFVEMFTATAEQVNAWALDGTIKDSKTQSALNWLNALNSGRWAPIWSESNLKR